MERLGASVAQEWTLNLLELADLNRAAVSEWQRRAAALAGEFELGLWVGPYPESDLEDVVKMLEVMNSAPRGALQVQDEHYTVEQQREWDAGYVARGEERWTMYVRHRSSRRIAGFTEVVWKQDYPEYLGQGDTGVFPEYRNRGIGRWLKAAMIEKVLRERPQVTRVRTGNAVSNEAMIGINREMGFKPIRTAYTWQVELDRVMEYLKSVKKS